VNTSWKLSISMSPFVFNAFHIPLVYNNNNFLVWWWINCSEQVLVSFINENRFEFWEIYSKILNIPVDHWWIQALFCILRSSWVILSGQNLRSFWTPECAVVVLSSLVEIVENSSSGFMEKTLPCSLIEMGTKEVSLRSDLFSLFNSKFNFKTWLEIIMWEIEMMIKQSHVSIMSQPEKVLSWGVPHVEWLFLGIFVKMNVVIIEFFLWIDIL